MAEVRDRGSAGVETQRTHPGSVAVAGEALRMGGGDRFRDLEWEVEIRSSSISALTWDRRVCAKLLIS